MLRVGTRGSPLALAQANAVRERLIALNGFAPDEVRLEIIRTTGDVVTDRPLAQAGGKGLFTKEIEEALLAGKIDLAVHSAKDMPTLIPAGLRIAAAPPREDARDAFISMKAQKLEDLPPGVLQRAVHSRIQLWMVDEGPAQLARRLDPICPLGQKHAT